MSMTLEQARAEATRRYGAGNFRLHRGTSDEDEDDEQTGTYMVLRRMDGWVPMVIAGRGTSWDEALESADGFKMHIHREPGWCIGEIGEHDPAFVREIKQGVLRGNRATESGLERLQGVHKGVPFEVEVGKPFVEPDDRTDHGVVLAIVRLQPGLLGIITTRRGVLTLDPLLVGEHEVRDEVTFALEMAEWKRRRR